MAAGCRRRTLSSSSSRIVSTALPATQRALFAVISNQFPLSNVWYVLQMVSDPAAGLLTWDMMCGSIASTTGSWQLEALGERTLATYTTTTDLGYQLPGFLVSLAMNSDLPNVIKAVRRQAE